jgi:peptidoglycan/xylan/chitin deacetylase (PgdA/CDA1 family)
MASLPRLACVSVDLDELCDYRAIHGLPEKEGEALVYARAVPRFCDLFAELGLCSTLFVVGRHLESPGGAQSLRWALAAGHEVANHTYAHRYDLLRLGEAEVGAEVSRGEEAIRAVLGRGCSGFRAPGYLVDERVLAACGRLGYRYDSSVFPSYPYYLAKAAIMAGMRLLRRPSRALLGSPRALLAPTLPYRPSAEDYRRPGGTGLWEIPVSLVPVLRFPFIGTWICLWSDRQCDLAYRLVRRSAFVNLELHGVELLGLAEDGIDPALSRQPDLRVPLTMKRRRLKRALTRLRDDFEIVTLAEAAQRLSDCADL